MYDRRKYYSIFSWDQLLIWETYTFDKGLIRALTIHAELTLIAHLVDKDLFAVASEDSLETQTAGKCRILFVNSDD